MFVEAKDDGGGGNNWTTGAISHAKLQSNHHHQQTNFQFFTGQMPFLSPNQQCRSTEGKTITFHGLAHPKCTWGVFQLCLWPLIAPGYLGEGLPCLSSALLCQYPSIRPYNFIKGNAPLNTMVLVMSKHQSRLLLLHLENLIEIRCLIGEPTQKERCPFPSRSCT